MSIEDLSADELRRALLRGYGYEAPKSWSKPRLLEEMEAQKSAREPVPPDPDRALPEEDQRKRTWKSGTECDWCRSTDTWVRRSMRAMAYPAVIEVRRRYHKCGHCGRNFRTESPL